MKKQDKQDKIDKAFELFNKWTKSAREISKELDITYSILTAEFRKAGITTYRNPYRY